MRHLILYVIIIGFPVLTCASDRLMSVSRDQISIQTKGINDTVKILHITDSHITIPNDEDKGYMQYAQRMADAYKHEKHYRTGQPTSASDIFSELMNLAKQQQVDLIAMTGDILNYPSATGVEFVKREVERVGIPYLYTSGNHDWHLEGMPGSANGLRSEWCGKILQPLYEGNNYLYSSKIIGGINFVSIDNSQYQISESQLSFFIEQRDRGYPIVLLMHIPIYTPTSSGMVMGNPQWGALADKNYALERRERWPETGNSIATTVFVREVLSTSDIAVLCGHTHNALVNMDRNMIQITGESSRNGVARIIYLVPKSN